MLMLKGFAPVLHSLSECVQRLGQFAASVVFLHVHPGQELEQPTS